MSVEAAGAGFALSSPEVAAEVRVTSVLCVGGPLNRQGYFWHDFEDRCGAAWRMYEREGELQPRFARACLYYHRTGERTVLPGGAVAEVLSFQPERGPRRLS